MARARTQTARRGRERVDRVCAICSENAGRDGVLGPSWEVHDVRPATLVTCSEACRETARWRAYEAAKAHAREAAVSAEDYERLIGEAARKVGV